MTEAPVSTEFVEEGSAYAAGLRAARSAEALDVIVISEPRPCYEGKVTRRQWDRSLAVARFPSPLTITLRLQVVSELRVLPLVEKLQTIRCFERREQPLNWMPLTWACARSYLRAFASAARFAADLFSFGGSGGGGGEGSGSLGPPPLGPWGRSSQATPSLSPSSP